MLVVRALDASDAMSEATRLRKGDRTAMNIYLSVILLTGVETVDKSVDPARRLGTTIV